MIFFRRREKNTDSKKVELLELEFTTYLSPWYFRDTNPKISKNLIWKFIEKEKGEYIGVIKLLNKNICFGIVDMYCYIKPIDSERFLIWERGTTKIEMYNVNDLQPIKNENDIVKQIKEVKRKYYFNSQPIEKVEYFFDLYQTEIEYKFPESFKEIPEIIQVNDINGMYQDYKEGMNNTAIVVLQPRINKILLYPQDWFNRDERVDFGYQWITRADRNKKTGKIHIQGIRIDDCILDETNRNIEK